MTVAYQWLDDRLIKAELKTLIWSEPLPGGGRAVAKMYRHRGLTVPVRRWLIPYRVQREFHLLTRLQANGVPCSEPLWWSHGCDAVNGQFELLATREIEAARPLAEFLRRCKPEAMPDLTPLFRLARQMHDCGIAHGAFYPANVLVQAVNREPAAFHLVDLAHGCLFAGSIAGSRPADFDLLDMLRIIARIRPVASAAQWMKGYGFDPARIRTLLCQFDRHRIERPWRHIRRAETDVREVLGRAGRFAAVALGG